MRGDGKKGFSMDASTVVQTAAPTSHKEKASHTLLSETKQKSQISMLEATQDLSKLTELQKSESIYMSQVSKITTQKAQVPEWLHATTNENLANQPPKVLLFGKMEDIIDE